MRPVIVAIAMTPTPPRICVDFMSFPFIAALGMRDCSRRSGQERRLGLARTPAAAGTHSKTNGVPTMDAVRS